LLLNIAPSPEGEWDEGAYQLLSEIGDWMAVNSEAIYGTKAMEPYKLDNICLTSKADGTIYLIYLVGNEQEKLPSKITFPNLSFPKNASIHVLGSNTQLIWSNNEAGIDVNIPGNLKKSLLDKSAFVIKIKG
ncbi:MAG: alpha-L-fucosidase, partial [Maribacter sp.]|nr:alpha-L-fucosidase [Maribacter sp.]